MPTTCPEMGTEIQSIAATRPSEAARPGQIREFEGLRGILAMWVVLVHALLLSGMVLKMQTGLPGLVYRTFVKGQHGVSVFVILSGFVVSMQLDRRQSTTGQFMANRFFRIYPLYLLSLGLGVVTVYLMPGILETGSWFRNPYFDSMHSVSLHERTHLHWHLLFHVLLIQAAVPNAWFPEAHWAILAPAWSLSHEWQFYLIAPRLRKAAISPMGLIVIAAGVVVASRVAGRLNLGLDWSLLATLPMFLVGILTFRFHQQMGSRPEVPLAQAMTPLCGLAAFAILADWKVQPIVIWTLVYATIVSASRTVRTPASVIISGFSGVLRNRVFLWLGSISYAIYLLHWPFMIFLLSIASKLRPEITPVQAFVLFAAAVPALLWISHLVHRGIELPAVAFGRRIRTEPRSYHEPIASPPPLGKPTRLTS